MLLEGRTLAPGASAGVETTIFKESFVFLKRIGLDTATVQLC
jgi:hypothetical protein